MIAKKGKIRQWHFAHKILTDNCCYETYLHALAKIKIQHYFYSVDKFEVEFKTTETCAKRNECVWFDDENSCDCESEIFQTFDLKRYYSMCDMEVSYRNFRADLFLYDNININRAPVFIEICVKHQCTEDKINSGIRIIELLIQTEDDIESVISSSLWQEGDNIRFYNFNRKAAVVDSAKYRRQLSKFILYDSLKGFSKETDCKSCNDRMPKAIFEITMKYHDVYLMEYSSYQIGLMAAYKYGYDIRNCHLCKYHRCYDDWFDSFEDDVKPIFCCLYKKLGTPKYCEYTQAVNCSAFYIDRVLYNDMSKYIRNCDVWRKDDAQ